MPNRAHINKKLPLDKAELIAFFLESVLFGVSALLYGITVWVIFYRRKSERLNIRLLLTSSLMMLFNTLHLAVDLTRIVEGLITRRNHVGGPIAYFARLFEWSFVFKTAIFVIQTVLADSFAAFRCYIVWNRWWVAAVVPAVSILATLATGIGVTFNCAILQEGRDVFSSRLTGWITAFFVLTFLTNFCCTSLTAARIWLTTRNVAGLSTGHYSLLPVVVIVVESGAIYSVSCITILVVYLLNSNAQYPAIDGMFPLISIVFNLIIVRIALGISHGAVTGAENLSQNPTSGIVDHHTRTHTRTLRSGNYELKPLAVRITQQVVQHKEEEAEAELASPDSDDDDKRASVHAVVASFAGDSEHTLRNDPTKWGEAV